MLNNNGNSVTDSLYIEQSLQKKLQDTEQKYRNLFEHMSEGLAYCRMIFKNGKPEDWEYLAVNTAFEKLTGLLNVTGKRVSEIIPGLKENDPELFERYSNVSLTGKPEKFEIYVTSLKEWFQISVYSPEREYFISIFDVITERKFNEESFRKSGSLLTAAMKLAGLGYWEYDIASDLFTFNDQFYSLLHTTAEKEGGYKMSSASYASRFVHPDDIHLVENEVSETIKTNDPEYNRQLEHRILYADGGVGYISVRFFASTNGKGRIIKTFGVNQDITVRRQYENNLEASKEKAERSEKLKDAFIANISHEIRTPLNGVLGMTKLIRDSASKYLNEEENEFFDSIEWANKRIIRTVDMILNFSRIQVGDFPLKPQYISLNSVVQNLLNEYKHAAHAKGLDISFVNNAGNIELLADEYCIGQALSNLINNAVKYTNSGRIMLGLQFDNNSDLLLNIEDSGIGISNEYLSRLFEPFTQEEVGYNRMYEGVGLGMSLVKKYLELNQAKICVKSKKNIGTVFTIKFQSKMLRVSNNNRVVSAVSKKRIQEDLGQRKEKLSVLLVEDDSINQMYIRSVCKKKYIISCVHSAAKALEALDSGVFDVILMDISLKGGMDGLELTKYIKADPRLHHLPVIAVTGHTSSKDIQNCNAAGCSGFLAKPFSDLELLEIIENVTCLEL